ncbi:hypothetical protein HK18_07645 [Commensalibacter intestini]|uniref:Uncharacterized protein n=1 Tax=Commensalibacter intestini TaxID=479936 RepID=A0A251ZVP8_9PROT|nr:hypothetical protein [Commensalibacter intestini]OUI78746.1 hypothetical protein HK18_07645 [Commensalibacter intestini]
MNKNNIFINAYKRIQTLLLIIIIVNLTACTEVITTEENSSGEEDSISKNEVIRVIVSPTIKNQDPLTDYGWNYNAQAKIKTENMFKQLGYQVINTGLAPTFNANQKPTLIAVTEAKQVPMVSPFIYSMSLFRPLSPNNPIVSCSRNDIFYNLCVAPTKINNIQKIFQTNCIYRGNINTASMLTDYCVKSAFTTFPKGSNKKVIYEINNNKTIIK